MNYLKINLSGVLQYFSDNKKHVESLMTQSNKIITTTTQLVSQNKIKKIVWKIDP